MRALPNSSKMVIRDYKGDAEFGKIWGPLIDVQRGEKEFNSLLVLG